MLKSFTFPSVIEINNYELKRVATDLIHGMKLYHDDNQAYIVGDLALSEGYAPHKSINSSPSSNDYQILAKAAMLLASGEAGNSPLAVTTGFPYVTFQLNRENAVRHLQTNHTIKVDTSVFSGGSIADQNVSVVNVHVIPELAGCDMYIRNGEMNENGNFFLVSLGYGTFEAALSTEAGIVQRTAVSGSGLRYAVNMAARELLNTHEVGLKTEHQFDLGFRNGSMVVNRQVIDLESIRRKYLTIYYKEVVSPLLAKAFTDADFSRTKTMFLSGGGALYTDIVEMFKAEFAEILNVKVVANPLMAASSGYAIYSKKMSEGSNVSAAGIDIGNSTTAVTIFKEGYSSFE